MQLTIWMINITILRRRKSLLFKFKYMQFYNLTIFIRMKNRINIAVVKNIHMINDGNLIYLYSI